MKLENKVNILKHIAILGGITEYVPIKELTNVLDVSVRSGVHTISKKIHELIDDDLISMFEKQQKIKLTEKGISLLRREYWIYHQIFEFRCRVILHGIVTKGMGEGYYYISQEKYKTQFVKKLNFDPYLGTLNLKIVPQDLSKLEILKEVEGIMIKGFRDKSRTFGDVKCFSAMLKNVECGVVLPKRSHYTDTLEVISKHHLRSFLGLKDGDKVTLTVFIYNTRTKNK